MQDNILRLSEKDIEKLLINHLGEDYRLYREQWNNHQEGKVLDFPIHMDFELNDLCNQSCVMCPRNEELHPDINYSVNTKTKLKFEDFKKVIDESVPKGLKSVNLGAFAEPLIHKDVFKMIRYAHDNGIVDSRIITNGLLLKRHINDIFESGLVNLFVSLDSFSEEKYKTIRGPGLTRIVEDLNFLLEERKRRKSVLPIVRVSFVDMEVNKDEKQAFIDYWKDKVDFIDFQIFDDYNVNINADFDLTKKKKWNCKSPFVRLSVMSDGRILPCCNFFGRNIPVGTIHNSSIEEVWKNEEFKKVREGVLKDDLRNCAICQRT